MLNNPKSTVQSTEGMFSFWYFINRLETKMYNKEKN